MTRTGSVCLAAAMLGASLGPFPGMAPANAQGTNLIEKATALTGSCGKLNDKSMANLSDGNPATAHIDYRLGACELIFRFDKPVAASRAILSTMQPGDGKRNKTNFVSLWGSHQSFGHVFFKLGEGQFAPDSLADIAFDEPIKLRSFKILLEASGKNGWPRGSYGHDIRLNDIALIGTEDAAGIERWPQKPMAPFKGKADPIMAGQATECDRLAGLPFSPDSHGHSRSDADINVPEALTACEIAVADQPESPRLAFNLARSEMLGERTAKAIARLASPLLADYAPAQYLLAKSFEDGTGLEKNAEKARVLYEKSAAQDFGPALHWLALKAHDASTKKIASGAKDLEDGTIEPNLKRAVEVGYLPAAVRYFEHVMKHGLLPVREAYAYIEQGAELGDPVIMGQYGAHLYNGYRISRRYADSRRYSLRAAKLNTSFAMSDYAIDSFASNGHYWNRRAGYTGSYWPMERLGKTVSNPEQRKLFATLAFAKALEEAEGGDATSMEWVAQYFASGFGTEKDAEKAKLWRCRAKAGGNAVALATRVPGGCGQ